MVIELKKLKKRKRARVGGETKKGESSVESERFRVADLLHQLTFYIWLTLRPLVMLIIFAGLPVLLWFSVNEFDSSRYQSQMFSFIGRYLTFRIKEGPAEAIRFPEHGPYDRRFGYSRLPEMLDRLKADGFRIARQAELSPLHARLIDMGVFPLYREKFEGGLRITDYQDGLMFESRHPKRLYRRFSDIPSVIVNTLLYIEDRKLLRADQPHYNPSIEWTRFGKAISDLLLSKIFSEHDVHGGSTLATQKEKFRHSSEGITFSPRDKLRQMLSASLRAYMNGPYTFSSRQEIVLQYINSVPLAAVAGFGEVNGLGDGLWAYFDADFDELNKLLASPALHETPEALHKQALAFRQILSLFLAHRRPSFYLGKDPGPLNRQIAKYLPALYENGVISEALFREARKIDSPYRRSLDKVEGISFVDLKGINSIRTELLSLLSVNRLYELDRFDLSVRSTMDFKVQQKVNSFLRQLKDKEFLRKNGLVGHRLLKESNDVSKVIFSFTLYERGEFGNILRIQTDSFDQPFNINEGVLLDLGSTSKLRTLVTYLQIIEIIYNEYKAMSPADLRKINKQRMDALRRWALEYVIANPNASVTSILEAAMQRRYSGSPAERFFTAGGMHVFGNFNSVHNGSAMTPLDALRHSVNLPFIRMMRDIAYYHTHNLYGINGYSLEGLSKEKRMDLLKRFTAREASQFLRRYYRKYSKNDTTALFDLLKTSLKGNPLRLAAAFGAIFPEDSYNDFVEKMQKLSREELSDSRIGELYDVYIKGNLGLTDQASVSGLHLFEIHVLNRLFANPKETFEDVKNSSSKTQDEYYSWLFKATSAHDTRLRIILEEDAFKEIHKMWKQVGYRNDSLVPSYATALGTSADQPAALAELMGIVANNGLRVPVRKIESLHFAADTPFETRLVPAAAEGVRVMHPEIARIVKEAAREVVASGTGVRLKAGLGEGEAAHIIGGKTGTGDNRFKVFGPGGAVVEDRVVSRTATFVFLIGDHSFGTMTVFVEGEEAGTFEFTSSLPVTLVKLLSNDLLPLLNAARERNKLLRVKRELLEHQTLLEEEYKNFTDYLERTILNVRERIEKKFETPGKKRRGVIRSVNDAKKY